MEKLKLGKVKEFHQLYTEKGEAIGFLNALTMDLFS